MSNHALEAALRAELPPSVIVTDPDVLEPYRRDQATTVIGSVPAVAVRARTTEHVRRTVRVASRLGVPLVPRGAGSGLTGGAAGISGAITLDLTRLDAVHAIEPLDQLAVVGAGVINDALTRLVAVEGLWYPPDPASAEYSTLGGNVATNAGGLCCVKYGVTRDWVLGLEAVTASGEVVRVGRRTMKGVAGYDLVGLLVGSEGTLAVITEVTLKLRPLPAPSSTMVAVFPNLCAAGEFVSAIAVGSEQPSLVEIMDAHTIAAVDEWKNLGLDRGAAALLVVQSDSPHGAAIREVETFRKLAEASDATMAYATADPAEGTALLDARRLALPALERQGTTMLDDVCVPRSGVATLMGDIADIAAKYQVRIGTFGHAGDGNLHPTIVFNEDDADESESARQAFTEILKRSLSLGGTVAGEHGIGTLKSSVLPDELGSAVMTMHRDIKSALDPKSILNPGKLWPKS